MNRLDERFAEQARRTPDAVALVDGDREWRYRDLAEAARRVRDDLAAAGVPAGSAVGLRMPRRGEVVGAILGILGHGCAYVPIDTRYPAQRQRFIADDLRLRALVEADGATGAPVIRWRAGAEPPAELPPGTAYVIYTSGSTGAPKGVLVGHEHVLALMDACAERYVLSDVDVWTLFHSHSFDFSVWELWGALLHGGQAVLVPPETAADAEAFARLLAAEEVTVLSQVPTAFGHLVRELEQRPCRLPALRYVVFGGEAVNLAAVRRWRELGVAPGAELVNMYGITETTVHVTHCPLGTDHGPPPLPGATPIGTPLPHLRVHLTDENLRPVPPGTPGEIVVSGAGVAYGYFDRPALTAARFVEVDGCRAYRSGDWAVRAPTGELYYIGRRDRQVQVRGFRIELGEPEAAVVAHPDVAQCAVTAVRNQLGDLQLVAHYAVRPGAGVTPEELRAYLAARLPAHLVPVLRQLPALPRTDNGKVDLRALTIGAGA
jgi:amino acid adenylation domain-containing protein